MTVNVNQLITEVIPEPEPSAAPGGSDEQQVWDAVARAREAYSRLMRDHARTEAEGFDD